MRFGYIRVSTVEQNIDRHYEKMKECNLDKIFTEKMSGKDRSRPVLQKMIDRLREGDSVTVLEVHHTSLILSFGKHFWNGFQHFNTFVLNDKSHSC